MIAIIPEPVIGMPRNRDRHRLESPFKEFENADSVKKGPISADVDQALVWGLAPGETSD